MNLAHLRNIALLLLIGGGSCMSAAVPLSHPRLLADSAEIEVAREWIARYPWYRNIFEAHKQEIDRFLEHRPVFVSPVKQTYQYKMYSCPVHEVELLYETFKPYEHRCPKDTTEVYRGGKYDAAWAGWYNRKLASHLVWMGLLYQVYEEESYAEAAREILLQFADLYLRYPTSNTILGPAHVFFGTLSESFWGVDMAYGYDLVYTYPGFTPEDHAVLKERLFTPLALITQQFPESASNRQLWYNNVSAAVGFLYGDQYLIDFAMNGRYGFSWQLGSALPESGLWAEWSGYHYVALRGMIHLAEMARHNGFDLYHRNIAGRTMKDMFDAPFGLVKPNNEFPRNKDSGGGNILEYAPFYEVGFAVYGDSLYLTVLNRTNLTRGTQVVGEESGAREEQAPITMFNLVPELPPYDREIYQDRSVNLVGNGFAILKNGSGDERRYLYLDYGIMGGEHGHPDRLQMGYYAHGRNWIVDPLNESYFNPNLQLWYRQTIAHNTMVLDQTSQTWTNGYGNFFGAVPSLQVASGGSRTAYPGATLTRTLIQAGDYFLDLADVAACDHRLIDVPLHSFGTVTIDGVGLREYTSSPFGPQPGIPGYDQLFDIRSGRHDGPWSATFTTPDGANLRVDAIGENGTEVFQAMTPTIGGAYKQMVKDPRPLPMVMARRTADTTRFAFLVHAYAGTPTVTGFRKGREPFTYIIQKDGAEDIVYCDVAESKYALLRSTGDRPALFAGFNVDSLRWKDITLFRSLFPLGHIECAWHGDTLLVSTVERFGEIRIHARNVKQVMCNGRSLPFRTEGVSVVIQQPAGIAVTVTTPHDSVVFAGYPDTVDIAVWNFSGKRTEMKASLALHANWLEHVTSQLTWWGGVVNLIASNKKPVTRTVWPAEYSMDMRWLDGLTSGPYRVDPGTRKTLPVPLLVPGTAPPVLYDVTVTTGDLATRKRISVLDPVTAEVMMPNRREQAFLIRFVNNRQRPTEVTATLLADAAWTVAGADSFTLRLGPGETREITVPVSLTGYTAHNQLYPVRLRLHSMGFVKEIVRDIYVGIAHRAVESPSLDGSWRGWVMTRPLTIDSSSQVCRLLLGNQPWNGAQDLSARVSVMYDDAFLYVGAEVMDDSLVTHWNFPVMSYPWDTDCMEVVLDTRANAAQGFDPPTPGLYRHLSMAEHTRTAFSAELWRGGGAGGPTLPKPLLVEGAETFFRRTQGGYTIICRLPLSGLRGLAPVPGMKIGFDLAVNDNDGTTYRKNQHIWAGYTQNQSWWDMGTIGALIFDPVPGQRERSH
jgi:Carbohydrate family 9 binding domain-like/Heparinase II/III-like protein/Alginate lyase